MRKVTCEKKMILGLAAVVALTVAAEEKACRTAEGVQLVRDGRVVWNFAPSFGKPCVHPLVLPDGLTATTTGDRDHSWHHGLWFSWKFLNGVNFWEEDKTGRAAGRQRIVGEDVRCAGASAVVTQDVVWEPNDGSGRTFLREKREISFSAPAADGSYAIVWKGLFTAVERTVIDRTPPKRNRDGHWSGGYAGFSLRLSDACRDFRLVSSSGVTNQVDVVARERGWIDYVNPSDGNGIRLEILKAPGRRVFYHWQDHRFTNLSPVFDEPIVLEKGETLELAYRATVHGSDDGRPNSCESLL